MPSVANPVAAAVEGPAQLYQLEPQAPWIQAPAMSSIPTEVHSQAQAQVPLPVAGTSQQARSEPEYLEDALDVIKSHATQLAQQQQPQNSFRSEQQDDDDQSRSSESSHCHGKDRRQANNVRER